LATGDIDFEIGPIGFAIDRGEYAIKRFCWPQVIPRLP